MYSAYHVSTWTEAIIATACNQVFYFQYNFAWTMGFFCELHTLTLAAHSYALLLLLSIKLTVHYGKYEPVNEVSKFRACKVTVHYKFKLHSQDAQAVMNTLCIMDSISTCLKQLQTSMHCYVFYVYHQTVSQT